MSAQALAATQDAAASRLLIHAASRGARVPWSLDGWIRRVRAHVLDTHRGEPGALALEIHNLQGQRLLVLRHAGPLVDLALPPGTYHVTTEFSGMRRRYTVALARGAQLDLYLRPASPH